MKLGKLRGALLRVLTVAGILAVSVVGAGPLEQVPSAGAYPSGLVAHYTFDNNNAADSSGNGNNGTLAGSPSFAAGPAGFGNSLVVDLGKYVVLPDTNTLSLYNHDFTVTSWINATAFSGLGGYGGDWAVLGNQLPNPVQGSAGLHLALRGGQPYMGFFGNDLGSGSNLSLNAWHHLAWRYTKATGEMALFLGGNQISAGGGHGAFLGTGSTYIGRCCESWDAPRYAKGQIDDVQIYNRPLTQSEIASLTAPPMPLLPATCTDILLGGGSVGNGVYTIDPAQNGAPVSVYCDMTTNGGGWTLAGYGANSNLAGKLNTANGSYSPTSRSGSANINALALAKKSTQVSLSWSNATANGGLTSYQEAVGYDIPNPSVQTLDPVGGGYTCVGSGQWSPVTVNKLVGAPNLPSQMYTRTASLGAVYGLAYGLARSNGNPQCDWTIDGQQFRAVYLGINSPSYATGVVYEPGGSANAVIPATMAIWFRGSVPLPPADSTAPVITPTVTGTLGNNGWYTSNVTVTWTVTDAESAVTTSGCGTQNVTSDTAGVTFTCSATSAGGSASASVTIKRDATAPSVTGSASPAAAGSGWHNLATGAPTVSFTGSDSTSGIASCTAPVTVSADGAHQQVSGSCTDQAGNVSSFFDVFVDVDLTAPTIAASRAPAANGAGWNNTDVTVSFSCSDATSGLAAPCPASNALTGDGANQSASGTATDIAGNSASATVSGINIDKTAPTVSIAGPGLALQGTTVSATVSAADALSGLAVNPSGSLVLDTSTVGSHTVMATATDQAGNSTTASLTYTVWGVNGPFAPVVKNGAGKGQFKAGSAIPVKFQLTDGANLITTATGTVTIGSATAAFRWDATAQQYIANVKTAAAAGDFAVTLGVTGAGSISIATVTVR